MSLETRKFDDSSRTHENTFFREFCANLRAMYEQEKHLGDAILIGFPKVPENEDLKPDCVLITKKRLVIIDFKEYGGKMSLPRGEAFETEPWREESEDGKSLVVHGGKRYINPFDQLNAYKKYLEDIIGYSTYGKFGIACLVCFSKRMRIINSEPVPGIHKGWFSICDKYEYLNRIRDIIGINGWDCGQVDMDDIASHFVASPYYDYYPVSFEEVQNVNSLKEEHDKSLRELEDKDKVIKRLESTIKSYEEQDKDTTKLKEELFEANREAEEAKKETDRIARLFENSQKDLDAHIADAKARIAQSEAQTAKSNAKKAESESRTAEANAKRAQSEAKTARLNAKKAESEVQAAVIHRQIQENKSKSAKRIVAALIALGLVLLGFAMAMLARENREKNAAEEAAKSQLEEDYKSGRTCIPIERVSEFVGSKNVCVEFNVYYVNYNESFVYLNYQDKKFQIAIPIEHISGPEAKAKYNKKRIKAIGNIINYGDKTEMMVNDLNQITIKD